MALALSLSPGQVVTYQLGSIEPFGASFKVTPETTETEVNVRKCFRINGTDGDLITPQSVFPSLENFKVSPGHGPPGCGMGQSGCRVSGDYLPLRAGKYRVPVGLDGPMGDDGGKRDADGVPPWGTMLVWSWSLTRVLCAAGAGRAVAGAALCCVAEHLLLGPQEECLHAAGGQLCPWPRAPAL